jgi:hypothetical protein
MNSNDLHAVTSGLAAHRIHSMPRPSWRAGIWRICLVLALALTLPPTGAVLAAAPGMWIVTGSLNTSRYLHTATLLPNGKVLVAGGSHAVNGPGTFGVTLSTAELYDPTSGAWRPTGAMTTGRHKPLFALLPNGLVLVAGGSPAAFGVQRLGTAELYHPTTGQWTVTGSAASPFPPSPADLGRGHRHPAARRTGTRSWSLRRLACGRRADGVVRPDEW